MRPKLRETRAEDLGELRRLHADQNRADGTNYPISDPRHCALALTAVTHEGEVLQGINFEKGGVEMMFVGCSPQATAIAIKDMEPICQVLRLMGYRYINCVVPKSRAVQVGKALRRAGFQRQDTKMVRYFKDLEGEQ